MAAVFTACDVSTLSESVVALVVAFVGIALIYVAKRHSAKAGIR